mgnify:CR=1 FL=1
MAELSNKWPVASLCSSMEISRSGFYKWKNRALNPSPRTAKRIKSIIMFNEYHKKYPSHGYRWLNAKIKLDTGQIMSNQFAHRCCKYAGIKSESKHYAYRKPGDKRKVFPNIILSTLNIHKPMEVIVSDMTAFWCNKTYYELTLYMDLWNNEIVSYGLSYRRGDPSSYYEGLQKLIEKKKEIDDLELILHTDQGSVYSSKSFNELLPFYHITHSMSRAGTPTDNGAMEAINGWVKTELFIDFKIKETDNVPKFIEKYIHFFKYQLLQDLNL